MEKKRKVIQVYAIIVNIVAIIAFLIAMTTFVSAIISRSNPMYVQTGWQEEDLSSFQKYKMDVLKSTKEGDAYIPSDTEIETMYDAALEEKVNTVMHRTWKDMVVSGIIVVISIIFFISHWIIMKKYDKME